MEVIELLIMQGNTSLSATFNGMNTTISRRKQDTFENAMQITLPACDSAQYIIPNFLDVALHYNEESLRYWYIDLVRSTNSFNSGHAPSRTVHLQLTISNGTYPDP
jgi:hypothetical protein